MIKIENTQIVGWEPAIRGMRNPKDSWARSDSKWDEGYPLPTDIIVDADERYFYKVGQNDLTLMKQLAKQGSVHAKYRRFIDVFVDITAPLYWWKEFDTYRVGVAPNPSDIEMNSCSSMHRIHANEFTLGDFSHEHLAIPSLSELEHTIKKMNVYRDLFVNWDLRDDNTKNALLHGIFDGSCYNRKDVWWQIIQLLPSSYNQKRTMKMNYEVLANQYENRQNHRLDEWREYCIWVEGLSCSSIITGKE